jgi:hypothetical protein
MPEGSNLKGDSCGIYTLLAKGKRRKKRNNIHDQYGLYQKPARGVI